jgi:hypothetical protein
MQIGIIVVNKYIVEQCLIWLQGIRPGTRLGITLGIRLNRVVALYVIPIGS